MTEPNDAAEASLDAILAKPIEEWPTDARLASALGMSPVYIRQRKAAARRQRRQPPGPTVTEPVPPPALDDQEREHQLHDYLLNTPISEWQLPPWLASHFQVSEVFVRQEMQLARTTTRIRLDPNL